MEATAEIPDRKFAKVGKDRERKKGGAPLWLSGGKGGSSFLGALGGEGLSGGGNLLAQLFPKFIMATMIASVGVGAFGLKMALSPQKPFSQSAKPKKLFDSAPASAQKYSGDLSSLPGGQNQNQSGLNMIQGGLGDDAAKAAAAAAAAAQANKQSQDAAAQGDKSAQAAPGTPDPAAMAAAAAAAAGGGAASAGKGSPFGSRFGALSSSFGSGSASPFSGGGMFGGVGHSFDNGKLNGFGSQAQAGRAQASASPTAHNPATRLAARQLNNAFGASKGALGNSTSEGMAYTNNRPWDNGGQQSGQVQGPIGGATTPSGGGAGAGNGAADSNGSGGGSYSGNSPSLGGTPSNPMTDCVQMLGPDYSNSPNGGCVQTTAGTDVTPWGSLVRIAGALLMAASVILTIASVLWMTMGAAIIAGHGIINLLADIAAVLGGIATMLGVAVMGMGQTLQGGLLTGLGAVVTTAAVMVRLGPAGAWASQAMSGHIAMVMGLVSGLLGSVFGGMSASSGSTASSMQ